MKKTVVIMIVIAALALSLTGCGKAPAAQNTAPAAEAQTPAQETTPAAETPAVPAATQTESAAAPEAEAFPARADGERFEDVIMIEGMEETVRYEHVKSAAFGFEMDYDYENFVRRSDADCERFVSVWDNAAEPENYIEVRSDTGNAELVADAIIACARGAVHPHRGGHHQGHRPDAGSSAVRLRHPGGRRLPRRYGALLRRGLRRSPQTL